ncbi:MAG: histidinol-phosphate transaminase [Gammaproteobacteria bacterium]
MKLSRRGFFGTVGMGAAVTAISGTELFGRRVYAQTLAAHAKGVYDGGIMQLNQNESARGPGPNTMQAIHNHTTKRVGRGYSPDHVSELQDSIADYYNIERSNVLLGTGSTPLLQGATRAFCNEDHGLVTAGPTYATSEGTARQINAPITSIQVDDQMYIQLDKMADAVKETRAGLVYVCNPNNPTGTVHSAANIERFVRRVLSESPNTYIHIDEAYINYADPAVMQTALPLVLADKRVLITRSFSKAHGLAGMRIGYMLGHEETIDAVNSAWGMGDVNMLGAVAALTALNDKDHIEWERLENAEIREFTIGAFRDMGYECGDSHTNHIFPNLRMPAPEFRAKCLENNILVGRNFPPLEQTHSRISLGSREEMQIAVDVFRKVLKG